MDFLTLAIPIKSHCVVVILTLGRVAKYAFPLSLSSQVFYMCQPNGNFNSFLCPNGTMFNQQYFICDWWYNVDCGASANFYQLNQFLYEDNPSGTKCTSLFCSEE